MRRITRHARMQSVVGIPERARRVEAHSQPVGHPCRNRALELLGLIVSIPDHYMCVQLLRRGLGDDVYRSTDRVTSIECSLRAIQDLDALHPKQIGQGAYQVGTIGTVDISSDPGVCIGRNDLGTYATEICLRKACEAAYHKTRNGELQVLDGIDLLPLQHSIVERVNGD